MAGEFEKHQAILATLNLAVSGGAGLVSFREREKRQVTSALLHESFLVYLAERMPPFHLEPLISLKEIKKSVTIATGSTICTAGYV